MLKKNLEGEQEEGSSALRGCPEEPWLPHPKARTGLELCKV